MAGSSPVVSGSLCCMWYLWMFLQLKFLFLITTGGTGFISVLLLVHWVRQGVVRTQQRPSATSKEKMNTQTVNLCLLFSFSVACSNKQFCTQQQQSKIVCSQRGHSNTGLVFLSSYLCLLIFHGHISYSTSEVLRYRKTMWLAQRLERILWQSRKLNPVFLSPQWVLLCFVLSQPCKLSVEKIRLNCVHTYSSVEHDCGMNWGSHITLINVSVLYPLFAPLGTSQIFFCPSRESWLNAGVLQLWVLFQSEILYFMVREGGDLNLTMSPLTHVTQVKMLVVTSFGFCSSPEFRLQLFPSF